MPSIEEQIDDRLWSDRELIHRRFNLFVRKRNAVDASIRAKQEFIYKILLELAGEIKIPLLRVSKDSESAIMGEENAENANEAES